jgi:hypothetical protein
MSANSRGIITGRPQKLSRTARRGPIKGMSEELICSTLGLPADRWPPDHYELLGLPPGTADAARVEAHVLDRMERLRKLQLTHPDAVTDAMNRLAQALVCLTDPTLKREYDVGLGLADLASPGFAGEGMGVRAGAALTPIPSPAKAGREELSPPSPLPQSRERGDRRQAYRKRARLRRLRSVWDAVGHCLADAERPFGSRAELVELIQNLGVLGLLSAEVGTPLNGAAGQPGALVIALTRQPILATRLHDLSRTYRRGLAGDWAAANARLRATESALRNELAANFQRRARRQLRRLGRWAFVEHLDLTLVLTGLAALGVALIRARVSSVGAIGSLATSATGLAHRPAVAR